MIEEDAFGATGVAEGLHQWWPVSREVEHADHPGDPGRVEMLQRELPNGRVYH